MGTIIKQDALQQASGTAVRAVAYDFSDMSEQADGYVRHVEKQAAAIIAQAERDAAAIRRDAETAGRKAAEAAIERILDEKVAKQMKTLAPALESAIRQILEAKEEWLCHWQEAAVDLAAAIAGRMVGGELTRRPEIAKEWIRESLELAAGSGEVAIHLNAGDYQSIVRHVEQLAAACCPLATVRVTPDEAVTVGGCRVKTEFGEIDGRLEARLERIKQELS